MRQTLRTFVLLLMALVTMLRASGSAVGADVPSGAIDLVIVTEDLADYTPGCDAVAVFETATGRAIYRGETHVSPGRLAAAQDLSVVVASPSNGPADPTDALHPAPWLYVATSRGDGMGDWTSGILTGADFATFGGVAVLNDGAEFLAATAHPWPSQIGAVVLRPYPPFYVRKYPVSAQVTGEQRVGPPLGEFAVDSLVTQILLSPDGDLAHLVTDNARIHTIDPRTMTEIGAPIDLPHSWVRGTCTSTRQ